MNIFEKNNKLGQVAEQEICEAMFFEKYFNIIWCECGQGIPLSFGVKALSDAIENHVLKHEKGEQDPTKAKAVSERIRNMLIKQVFEKTSKR